MSKRKSVCLFGLSADPPTSDGGHGGIVKVLAKEGFDEVRVIPVYQHTFSEKRGRMASYSDRVSMCRLAFGGIPNVTVSEVERICFEKAAEKLTYEETLGLRVGTADLLDMLIEKEPDTDFTFALGGDTFMDLTSWKWRRSRDVLSLLQGRFIIVYRVMDESDKQVSKQVLEERMNKINVDYSGKARILNVAGLKAVSSSLARSCRDRSTLEQFVEPCVLHYIEENRMYGLAETD